MVFIISCNRDEEEGTLLPLPKPALSRLDPSAHFPVGEKRSLEKQTREGDRAERARAHGRLGMLYHAYRLYHAADVCYTNAGILDDKDPRWPYLGGLVMRRLGEYDQARLLLSEAVRLDPEHTAALLGLGELELMGNRGQVAEGLFQQVLDQERDQTSALIGLGRIQHDRGDFPRALAYYKRAAEREPDATAVHYLMAMTYRDMGREQKAAEAMAARGEGLPVLEDPLLAEIETMRNDPEAMRLRGFQAARMGRYAEAVQYYREALARAPEDARIWINLAHCFRRLSNEEEARLSYQKALEFGDDADTMTAAHIQLGDMAGGQAGFDHYRAALETNPHDLVANFRIAEAMRAMGRADEALPYYRRILEDHPHLDHVRLGRAVSLIRLGLWQETVATLEDDIHEARRRETFVHMFTRVLAACPDPRFRDGSRALRLLGDSPDKEPEVVATRAMALAEIGDYTAAEIHMLKAVALAVELGQSVAFYQAQLQHYRDNQIGPEPWPENHPLFRSKFF